MFVWTLWTSVRQCGIRETWNRLFAGLRQAPGWAWPMGLIAGLASVAFGAQMLGGFGISFFILGCVVAFAGCIWFVGRALRSVWRMGVCGWWLARWWFELASITWVIFLFCLISGIGIALLAPALARGMPGQILFVSFQLLFLGFFATATLGYVLSFVARRPRRGKAYECVRYFYCTVGGCSAVTWVFMWGVPQIGIPDWVALCFLGLGGVAALLAAIVAFRQRRLTFRRDVACRV